MKPKWKRRDSEWQVILPLKCGWREVSITRSYVEGFLWVVKTYSPGKRGGVSIATDSGKAIDLVAAMRKTAPTVAIPDTARKSRQASRPYRIRQNAGLVVHP